jgi:hypothetical protein
VVVDTVYCTSLSAIVTVGLDRQLRVWSTHGVEHSCWPLPGKSLPTKLTGCRGATIACGFQDGAVWCVLVSAYGFQDGAVRCECSRFSVVSEVLFIFAVIN